jgi:hypothetical protein
LVRRLPLCGICIGLDAAPPEEISAMMDARLIGSADGRKIAPIRKAR